jgi:hypothetical protein
MPSFSITLHMKQNRHNVPFRFHTCSETSIHTLGEKQFSVSLLKRNDRKETGLCLRFEGFPKFCFPFQRLA